MHPVLQRQLVHRLVPLTATKATCALNAAQWLFRLPAIASPFLGLQYSLTGGPVFGLHYDSQLPCVSPSKPSATEATPPRHEVNDGEYQRS